MKYHYKILWQGGFRKRVITPDSQAVKRASEMTKVYKKSST